MVTFNVDSLDFVDDEEARFGADADFATRFDSANSRLELEDLTAGAVGYVPQGTSTDLVGGKFAETVSEGKALADDGNVYDSIQDAVDNASSWVKVGPGTFNESVSITTAGLTLKGSGERTKVFTNSGNTISVDATNCKVLSLSVVDSGDIGIFSNEGSTNTTIANCTIRDTPGNGISIQGDYSIAYNVTSINSGGKGLQTYTHDGANGGVVISNCVSKNASNRGILLRSPNSIIVNNTVTNPTNEGIKFSDGDIGVTDCIVYGNRIENAGADGIDIINDDNIVAKNLISDSGGDNIDDSGTGTVLDANLTT